MLNSGTLTFHGPQVDLLNYTGNCKIITLTFDKLFNFITII